MEQPTNQRTNMLLIKDMSPVSRNFDCEVIVLQKGKYTSFFLVQSQLTKPQKRW